VGARCALDWACSFQGFVSVATDVNAMLAFLAIVLLLLVPICLIIFKFCATAKSRVDNYSPDVGYGTNQGRRASAFGCFTFFLGCLFSLCTSSKARILPPNNI